MKTYTEPTVTLHLLDSADLLTLSDNYKDDIFADGIFTND